MKISGIRPRRGKRAVFDCPWCKEQLIPRPFTWYHLLRGFGILRPHRCPHCMTYYYRPTYLPWQKDDEESAD